VRRGAGEAATIYNSETMTWLAGKTKPKQRVTFFATLRCVVMAVTRCEATLSFFLCPRTFLIISAVVECFKVSLCHFLDFLLLSTTMSVFYFSINFFFPSTNNYGSILGPGPRYHIF